jgi:pimeloyl-ACP methyl ester carboxylesterase
MGGMTIMALAGGYPGLFGRKIVGAVLIATAAAGLSSPDGLVPWLPGPGRMFLQRVAPVLLRGASVGKRAILVEGGRLMSRELELVATRFLAFGDPQASLTQTEFLERMIRDAPVGVISEFFSALLGCDQREALDVLGNVPVTVVAADRDRLIPTKLTVELAETIPGARLALVPGAGHVAMMERPDVINDAILSMLAEVQRRRPARKLGRRRGEKGEKGERGVA